ncbi:MAG: type II secretion system protein [Coriobacteriia bacterium]|nr:type II secretion system protein [Coriobacteriia bacterium]
MPRVDRQDGFTLVELMVVVLIIGILVAIAIPVFNNAAASARLKTCMSNQRLIEGAIQTYRATGAAMFGQGRFNGNGTASTADVLVPNYLKAAPVCPTSGRFYWIDATGRVTGDTNAAGFTTGHSHY